MRDPNTIAFEIYLPKFWKKKRFQCFERLPILTIWHCDPEIDRSDNSCDWIDWKIPGEKERRYVENLDISWYKHELKSVDSWELKIFIKSIWIESRRYHKKRPWYKHPKWHIHHWRIQVLQEYIDF